tara:strand:- start:140 stop:538 length:399 start_codon:yes stop_codon:yes gene_type:complete
MKINISIVGRLIGVLLIVSSMAKLLEPQPFFGFIDQLGVENKQFILSSISFIELVLGLFGVLGYYKKLIFGFFSILFLTFASIHFYAMNLGITSCGCFGEMLLNEVGIQSIIFNIMLSSLSVLLFYKEVKKN